MPEQTPLEQCQQLLLEVFQQATWVGGHMCRNYYACDHYNHCCISAYEDAQAYLLEHKLLDKRFICRP